MNFTPLDIIPDVSFYQDNDNTPQGIDFFKMAGVTDGVIIRGGQGSWADSDFYVNYTNAKNAGLKRGVYWFYDSRYEPLGQAKRFADLVLNDPPEWGLWLDLEESYNGTYKGEANWKKCVNEIRRLFNGVLGIYTANWWWSQQIILDYSFWGAMPLWVAQYTSSANGVILPRGWSSAVLWQYTSSGDGPVYGVESPRIDLNYTSQEFYNLFGGTPPPGNGDIMHYFELKSNKSGETRSIRGDHPNSHIQGAKIGQINVGNHAKALNKFVYTVAVPGYANVGDTWWAVYEANGTTIKGWCAEIHLGVRYLNVVEVGTPVPDSDISGVKFSGEVVFDYTDGRQEVWHISDAPLTKGQAQ